LLLLLAAGLVGCSASHAESAPRLAPDEALVQVRAAFERLAASDDPTIAREAWEQAHHAFARGLEEPIRQGCGDRAATELEYGFAWLGAAIEPARHDRASAPPDARPDRGGGRSSRRDARLERVSALSEALEQLACL